MNAPLRLDAHDLIGAAEQSLRDELADLIEDARPADWWERPRDAFPATLKCGCAVKLREETDGDSVWTERRWTLCDAHEAIGAKP